MTFHYHHWFFPNRWTWVPNALRQSWLNLLPIPASLNLWLGKGPWWRREVMEGIFRGSILTRGFLLVRGIYGAWKHPEQREPKRVAETVLSILSPEGYYSYQASRWMWAHRQDIRESVVDAGTLANLVVAEVLERA